MPLRASPTKNSERHPWLGFTLPSAWLRAGPIAALLGTAGLVAGCAGGPVAMAPQASIARKTARVRAQVHGEGADVVVAGTVLGLNVPGGEGHVDIAAYDLSGVLILSASAPYVPSNGNEASFEERLPGLRGRRIRLRLAHHGAALPAGSGSCPNNAALKATSSAGSAAQPLEKSRNREYPPIEEEEVRGISE